MHGPDMTMFALVTPVRRRGFSIVELLVVVGIIVILFSIFVPYVAKMREADRRAECANNLRGLFGALTQYGISNGHQFPSVASDPTHPAGYVAYTGAAWVPPARLPVTTPSTVPASTQPAAFVVVPPVSPVLSVGGPSTRLSPLPATGPAVAVNRPAADAVQFNDVTASLWLLVRMECASPQQFVCPSASESPDPMLVGGKRVRTDQRSNFTSGQHLSYSYCSPFSAAENFRLNSDSLDASFAILADKNPGIAGRGDNVVAPAFDVPPMDGQSANSRNHNKAGQNVLYSTGVVEFHSSAYCGYGFKEELEKAPRGAIVKRDNIYTVAAPEPSPGKTPPAIHVNGFYSPRMGPAWAFDSYLVPTDDE